MFVTIIPVNITRGSDYVITSGSSVTKLTYVGSDLIAEYDGAGTLLRRYVHGPGMDNPIVWEEYNGAVTERL